MARIIAGRYSSRRILTPPGDGTRPTTDRVRESIFQVLAATRGTADLPPEEQLSGEVFLDLYAGSGAVGLEAASRGAMPIWVEKNAATARVIQKNKADLGASGRIVTQDVRPFMESLHQPVTIVWMDPPYDMPDETVQRVVDLAAVGESLVPDGIILVERSYRSGRVEFPESFLNTNTRRYGDTVIHMGRRGR